jgi:hypothetical protein
VLGRLFFCFSFLRVIIAQSDWVGEIGLFRLVQVRSGVCSKALCVCGCVFERLDVWWSIRGGAFEVCKSTAGRGGGGVGVGVSVSISWSSIFFVARE